MCTPSAARRGGVEFRFFHRADALRLSADRTRVEEVEFGRPIATVDDREYDPPYDVDGLPCWPSEPLYEQLEDGEALRASGEPPEDGARRDATAGRGRCCAGRDAPARPRALPGDRRGAVRPRGRAAGRVTAAGRADDAAHQGSGLLAALGLSQGAGDDERADVRALATFYTELDFTIGAADVGGVGVTPAWSRATIAGGPGGYPSRALAALAAGSCIMDLLEYPVPGRLDSVPEALPCPGHLPRRGAIRAALHELPPIDSATRTREQRILERIRQFESLDARHDRPAFLM